MTPRVQFLENALQCAQGPIPNLSPTLPENPLHRRSSLNDAALAANGAHDSLIPSRRATASATCTSMASRRAPRSSRCRQAAGCRACNRATRPPA